MIKLHAMRRGQEVRRSRSSLVPLVACGCTFRGTHCNRKFLKGERALQSADWRVKQLGIYRGDDDDAAVIGLDFSFKLKMARHSDSDRWIWGARSAVVEIVKPLAKRHLTILFCFFRSFFILFHLQIQVTVAAMPTDGKSYEIRTRHASEWGQGLRALGCRRTMLKGVWEISHIIFFSGWGQFVYMRDACPMSAYSPTVIHWSVLKDPWFFLRFEAPPGLPPSDPSPSVASWGAQGGPGGWAKGALCYDVVMSLSTVFFFHPILYCKT